MSDPAVSVLRRVKQARMQREEAQLRQAQSARRQAIVLRMQAEQAAAEFATTRCAEEAVLHGSLVGGPISTQRLRQAAAQLSGLAAHAAALRQRVEQAVQVQAGCDEAAERLRRTHAAALREAACIALLQQELDAVGRIAAERHQDAELEAVAVRCRPVLPGWPLR